MRIPRELRTLAFAATIAGWSITVTGKTHLKWKSPTGAMVVTASTPSDRRTMLNVRGDLRRNGLVV